MKKKLLTDLPKINKDFQEGIKKLAPLGKTVMVYGSARISDGPIAEASRNICRQIAETGFGVMTGGGPGLMCVANEAAQGISPSSGVSLNIKSEPHCAAMDERYHHVADYFFTRKVLQVDHCDAFLVLPGSVGSMDEFFEIITLLSTGKIAARPLAVYNINGYYDLLIDLLENFIRHGALTKKIYDHFIISDNPVDIVRYLTA